MEDRGKYTDAERTALLMLLRAGLWEREPEDFSGLTLPDESWENIFRLAREQTVTGITFRGLQYLPDSMFPPESLLLRWAAQTDAIERQNRQMNKVLAKLNSIFREKGLNPILLKGQGVARFYEQPLLRECGDIDFYFNNSCAWESALIALGFRHISMKEQADKGVYYRWQGVDVEHHRRLFDLYNPFLQGFANGLEQKKGYSQFALTTDSEVRITVPSPFLDLLLQNLHILKHTLGRGIGLRQLCDMARTCYKLYGETNTTEMKSVCRKLGLEKWCPLLHAFLTTNLGMPAKYLPYPETAPTPDPLAELIWRGGNFGQYDAGFTPKTEGWRRKRQTAWSFIRNVRFAFRYAPQESLWFFTQLMKGQLK